MAVLTNPAGFILRRKNSQYIRTTTSGLTYAKKEGARDYAGAWKPVKLDLDRIKELQLKKISEHRQKVKMYLACLGADRTSKLLPTQYEEFYNFLKTL